MRLATSIAPAVFSLAAISLAGCSQTSPPPAPPIVVGVIAVRSEPLQVTTELTGRTVASEVAEVRPQVSGIITARLFTEGATVSAGQPLYQLDARPYAATTAQARAALASASATVDSNRLRSERYHTLATTGGISRQDAADAEASYNQARAQVGQARAALDSAAINLEFTRITSPITGRIGRSSVTKGALVTADQATALAKVQRLDPIWVDIQQSSADFIALRHALASGKLGAAGLAPVRLILADGSEWPAEGRIDFADIDVNESTGTVTLRATVPNPKGELLPGLFVKARLVEGIAKNAMLVPQAAVTRDQRGNPIVLVVGRHETVEQREIATTSTQNGNWVVTAGLSPGDRVVVEGQLTAKPGSVVKVVPASASALGR